jgi:hypothetical protein
MLYGRLESKKLTMSDIALDKHASGDEALETL